MNIEIPISNLLLAPSGERPLEISITTAPASCPLYAKNKNEKICHCSEINFFLNFSAKTYDEIIEFNKEFFSKEISFEHIFPKQKRLFECNYFKSDQSMSQTIREPLKEELIGKMSDFLSIFLKKNKLAIQNDQLKLYLLDTTQLRKIVNFKNILIISNYKFMGDILAKNEKYSIFYSNLLEFFYIYYLKKEFYMYDGIKSLDLERTNPIFRYISQLKNKNFYENFQENILDIKSEKKNIILELIKICLDKFIPNINELYSLNNSKPHVFILKIVHFVYKYRIISEEDSNFLIDLLRDKMNLLKSYERIWNDNWNQRKSEKLSTDDESSPKKGEELKLNENELIFWAEILTKIRQLYSQIIILYIFLIMDKNMVSILNDFESNKIIFDNTNNEILIDKDKKLIKEIENKINFEKLGFFQEENGKILMRVFFNYILVNYENSLITINYKICEMSKIFLNLFSNVTDVNLNSLKLLNSTTEIYLKKIKLLDPNSNLNFLEGQEKTQYDSKFVLISGFCQNFEKKYLREENDNQEESKENDFLQDLKKLINHLNFEEKEDIYIMTHIIINQSNFLWLLLNLIIKYNNYFNENADVRALIRNLIKNCIKNNIFAQDLFKQKRISNLFENQKNSNNDILIDMIKILFKEFPKNLISNQIYLDLFFNFLETIFIKTSEINSDSISYTIIEENNFYKHYKEFFKLMRPFINENNLNSFQLIPEYDIIILQKTYDFIKRNEKFFDSKNISLSFENNNKARIKFYKLILSLIGQCSSKRIEKQMLAKLQSFFSFKELCNLLGISKNYELKTIIFRLLRNLYIFHEDNIFDDEEKITFMITSLRPESNSKLRQESNSNSTVNNKKKDPTENYSEMILPILIEELKLFITNTNTNKNDTIDLREKIPSENTIKKDKFEQKEKKKYIDFGGNMLISTINHLSTFFITKKLLTTRRGNILRNIESNNIKTIKTNEFIYILQLLNIIKEDFIQKDSKLKYNFGLDANANKINHKDLFETSDLENLAAEDQENIKIANELVDYCNYFKKNSNYSNKYKNYNLGFSIEMVKRFSNSLKTRQETRFLPFQILKSLINNEGFEKNEKFGMIIGSIYESYKLKRLSSYSSIKKNYEEKDNNNIFFEILRNSITENDDIAKNMCIFLYGELMDENELENNFSNSQKKKKLILEGSYNSDISENKQIFKNGYRNNKYIYLEIFSNVLFHSTSVIQTYINEIITKKNSNFLDLIWIELLQNLTFVYNRVRQDKLWKEFFIRTILLFKFHQYLCEEDNKEFKKKFNENTLKITTKEQEKLKSRFEHLDIILKKFFFRCDWQKKKKNTSLMKKTYLFPVAATIFEFLAELTCGPCFKNQEKLSEIIHFNSLSSFLSTDDLDKEDRIKNKQNKREFFELKSSICEFLLMLCEGNDKKIIENQLKKINFYDLLETITNLIKILTEEQTNSKKFDCKSFYEMVKNYENSVFNDEQCQLLNIALKLFIYLNKIKDHNVTLLHLLEKKEDLALLYIEKSKKLFFWQNTIPLDNENSEIKDYEEGLCLIFLGRFAKKLELNLENEKNELKTEYIFFEPNSKFSFLSKQSKQKFIEEVDRTNHQSKIHGLITNCTYFEEEINLAENSIKRYSKLNDIYKHFNLIEIFLFLLSLVINFVLLIDYRNATDSYQEHDFVDYIIILSGSFELFLSSVCLVIWFLLRFNIEKTLNEFRFCENKGLKLNDIYKWQKFKIIIEAIFNENLVRVLILHILCCVLGLTLSIGFFAIDILSIINLASTFKYLAKSISSHGHQLLFTFFMTIIIIYVYSVFSSLYFDHNFENDECDSLIQCYFTILSSGFINGSGVGGILSPELFTKGNSSKYFGYVFVSITFFIAVNCIMLNLVFGIIVDTFGELREQSEKYVEDFKNYCFICQLNRYDYEKTGAIFKHHLEKKHDIWNYAKFIIYMKNKTEKDCNGIEGKIFKKIKNGDISWVPFAREEDENDNINNQVKKIEDRINILEVNFNKKIDQIIEAVKNIRSNISD